MGRRKVTIKQSAAFSIAQIAWFIESNGMVKTAEKFVDDVYDYLLRFENEIITYPFCRDEKRKLIGLKCKPYKRKFTIVILETDNEIIITEFIASKLIY